MFPTQQTRTIGAITFYRPAYFWFGAGSVTTGVILHIPMYLHGKHNSYKLVGMAMDFPMIVGMVAILIGLVASLYGLYPKGARKYCTYSPNSIQIRALDEAPITPAHLGLLLVMAFAVTIDIMKPTSLAFVTPGMTVEYGLKSPLNPSGGIPAAYVPLSGIAGTVLGSLVWGWMGDRIGRRASILLAGITFIATSICGAMPNFYWNLMMCFIMGLGVGGMLPIAYALLAETIPTRHRGWLMVLVGADVAGAYILTSWLASELVPTYSWRILWLIGLPTGVIFVLLNRWIPESARFLIINGREAEARAVMAHYGAKVIVEPDPDNHTKPFAQSRWMDLFSVDLIGLTVVVACLGIGSGLVLFGFNLWIPTNLRVLGVTNPDAILRNAALIGFPLTFIIAWLYGFWSSKKTLLILTSFTGMALLSFAFMSDSIVQNRTILYASLIAPIWGINSVMAVLSVYCTEIYPTIIRSKGSGFCAGASKVGGVLMIATVAFGFISPSISVIALTGAVAMALAIVVIVIFGTETTTRPLEEITKDYNRKNQAKFLE